MQGLPGLRATISSRLVVATAVPAFWQAAAPARASPPAATAAPNTATWFTGRTSYAGAFLSMKKVCRKSLEPAGNVAAPSRAVFSLQPLPPPPPV